ATPTTSATRWRSARATSVSCSTVRERACARRSRGTSMREPTQEFEHGYTCDQVVELATDYVEHALPAELVESFEMHLNFCDGCFTFSKQIRTTAELGGRLTEAQIPQETKAQLLAAFRELATGVKAYKFLTADGRGVLTGFAWPLPNGAPGDLVEAKIELCRS